MCHILHRDRHAEPSPILSFGRGFKIFTRQHVMKPPPLPTFGVDMEAMRVKVTEPASVVEVCSMLGGPYTNDPGKDWVDWKQDEINATRYPGQRRACYEEGFCFFLNRAEAKRALNMWVQRTRRHHRHPHQPSGPNYVILEIDYRMGIGEVNEYGFIQDVYVRMALARSFRLHQSTPRPTS
jgi:hypothetical protein